jgi:hypothetical protein
MSEASAAASGIVIRGTTDASEIAAVLAVLAAGRPRGTTGSGYENWRKNRLKALRHKRMRETPGL